MTNRILSLKKEDIVGYAIENGISELNRKYIHPIMRNKRSYKPVMCLQLILGISFSKPYLEKRRKLRDRWIACIQSKLYRFYGFRIKSAFASVSYKSFCYILPN